MSRRFDMAVASYRNPKKLARTLSSIVEQSTTDWRCFIVHNPSDGEPDSMARDVIEGAAKVNPRFVPVWMDSNVGYAGAICAFSKQATTEYLGYCDNDIEIITPGWDERLCSYLDRFHEIGMIFPNNGPYSIDRGQYHEVMWGVGFCWVLNRLAMLDVGAWDTSLGHQEEADYCLRVRMAGWKCACAPEVAVGHDAAASSDPAAIERINTGVVNWMNKWCRYFGGKNLNYHSPNVLRFEDWPPNALYLEEFWKLRLANDFNRSPEVVTMCNREYDLIKVPRLKEFYRGRII